MSAINAPTNIAAIVLSLVPTASLQSVMVLARPSPTQRQNALMGIHCSSGCSRFPATENCSAAAVTDISTYAMAWSHENTDHATPSVTPLTWVGDEEDEPLRDAADMGG
uniref:Uncharacterized protein n=1 Tax=Oryza meridionalis TaxID=40149 RepID=A0A0E0EBG8_9ORYZ